MLCMNSCKRNYQVNYARVAVDTLQRNDIDSADDSVDEFVDESVDGSVDEYIDDLSSEESLFEIPEIPQERTIRSGANPRRSRQTSENEETYSGKEQE